MNPFHSFSKGNKHLHSVCLLRFPGSVSLQVYYGDTALELPGRKAFIGQEESIISRLIRLKTHEVSVLLSSE